MPQSPIDLYKKLNTFSKENGMILNVVNPGSSVYTMKILDKHLSSPNTCHGGVIAGFMDAVLGASALSLSFETMELVSTVEFKINYFKPVFLGDNLIGYGKIDFEGKSLITVTGNIYLDNKDKKLVAKAIGTFKKYPIEKKAFADLFKK